MAYTREQIRERFLQAIKDYNGGSAEPHPGEDMLQLLWFVLPFPRREIVQDKLFYYGGSVGEVEMMILNQAEGEKSDEPWDTLFPGLEVHQRYMALPDDRARQSGRILGATTATEYETNIIQLIENVQDNVFRTAKLRALVWLTQEPFQFHVRSSFGAYIIQRALLTAGRDCHVQRDGPNFFVSNGSPRNVVYTMAQPRLRFGLKFPGLHEIVLCTNTIEYVPFAEYFGPIEGETYEIEWWKARTNHRLMLDYVDGNRQKLARAVVVLQKSLKDVGEEERFGVAKETIKDLNKGLLGDFLEKLKQVEGLVDELITMA